MNLFKDGKIEIPKDTKVEFIGLPTVEVEQGRYEELIRKETQLEFLKKFIASKVSYYNHMDISELLVLLDIERKKEE